MLRKLFKAKYVQNRVHSSYIDDVVWTGEKFNFLAEMTFMIVRNITCLDKIKKLR